ncbi:MAG: cyanophycin synthetase, partial [Planctomycetota bacterium]
LEASREARARVETFGIGLAANWEASNLQLIQGCYAFDVTHEGRPFGDFQLRIAGRHNVENALAAIAVLAEVGLASEAIAEHLLSFRGTSRRFEHLGKAGEIELVDDYAHHPTEIRATLGAARERFGQRRLIVVFQPHQYSRTRFLFTDFVASFDAADVLVVPDIYFVRDSEFERSQVNSHDLVMEIAKRGVRALHIATFEEIEDHLAKILEPNDVLITMGAGNVNEIARRMHGRLLAAVR